MAIIFFILIIILLPNPSTASDFISLNQSISGDKKLISKNGDFELGFFRPRNSSYYYIGIWYSLQKVPKLTSVWVANRETPISDLSKTELKISMSGNLVIANSSNPSIWSTKVTSISSNATTVAILLDSGNLVLRDGLNSNLTLWQSFDHPTDTWLPDAKLGLNKVTKESQRLTSWKNLNDPSAGRYSVTTDPLDSGQFVIQWNNKKTYWSSGNWNGRIFSSAPEMTANGLYDFDCVSNENEVYFTYSLNLNNPVILRWIIDMSGQMRQLIWVEDIAAWSTFWSQPIKPLDVYAFCGPFGSGNDNALPFCNCIIGFEPKSLDEWLESDYTQGCKRKSQLQCGFNRSHLEVDRYLPMDDIRLPDNPLRLNVDDISDCKNYCLSNCSCSAYYIADNSSCSFWVGDLLNLEAQYASDMSGSGNFFLRLAASELPDPKTKNSRKATVIIMVSIAGGVLLLACVVCFLWKMKKRIRRIKIKITLEATSGSNEHSTNRQREDNIELALFEVSTIVTATNYFSAANKLGVGGFGPVYKGILGPDQEIAVKRLSKTSMQGVEEFKTEVTLIAKLQHRNLVRLLGCCIHREERMLIYEYMSNKSLDAFLFEKKGPLLDWKTRYQIILGVTRGLLYLHHDSRLRIIHRDLKASNILLDKNMNPKISDFGLARILTGDETTDFNTRKVVGTYGYMSPEYAMEGIFSMKSDVFSFGVLLLEIVSGRKNRGKYTYSTHLNLVAHAWSLWNEGKSLHLVDETLSDSYSEVEVMKCIKVGLLCVQERATDRPLISSVIEFLANASDIASIPMPKRPGFISTTSPIETDSVSEIHEECTSNDITVSLEGR